jgi:hypothetical protein
MTMAAIKMARAIMWISQERAEMAPEGGRGVL